MKYLLTAIAQVSFEYVEGAKDSNAIGCATILHSEGIDENIFIEKGEVKSLNEKGVSAMQRVFASAIAANIKYAEQKGFQSQDARDEQLTKMVKYILSELARYDAKKDPLVSITKDGLKKV